MEVVKCRHCQTEFLPASPDEEFCCGGCAFVHEMIHDNGLDRYYALKSGKVTAPVKGVALQHRDFAWLAEKVAAAQRSAAAGEAAVLELAVQGISCVGCVWLLEKVFAMREGALRARVRANPGRIHLEWTPGACDVAGFADEARQFGYLLAPVDRAGAVSNSFSGRLGLCGAFAMNAMAFSLPRYLGMDPTFSMAGVFQLLTVVCATLAVLTGGSWFITRAWKCLRRGVLHMDLPIAAGILIAYAGSLLGWLLNVESLVYFDFVATFTFLMLAGRRLQTAAADRNRDRILGDALVRNAVTGTDGHEVTLEEMTAGLAYRIEPGQTVPVASQVRDGQGTVSLESINGEAEPRRVESGGRLAAGSLNIGRQSLELEALETWQDSLFRKLREQPAGEEANPVLQKILSGWILTVMILAVGGGIGWWLFSGSAATGLQVMVSLLVVSCPCAIGIALPLADDLATAAMERHGVFVRQAGFWSRLLRVRKLIFDKTGTLTLEAPVLTNPEALESLQPAALSALAVLTGGSLHPVSRALLEWLSARRILAVRTAGMVREVPGFGVAVTTADGMEWTLGRPGWDGQSSSAAPDAAEGDAAFSCEGVVLATLAFADRLRPGTRDLTHSLQARGWSLHILSGDRAEKVQTLAEEIGIDWAQVHGGLTPDEKAAAVRAMDAHDTLYIGDGANDALAFDAAWCTGTPVVDKGLLESRAGFYFLGRSLGFLDPLLATAARRGLAVRRVTVFAGLYNAGAAVLCLSGHMNPLLAAILMPVSSVITLAIAAAHFRKKA